MKDSLTRKIWDAAPKLYNPIIYFDVGDGWYNLILKLSKKLEALPEADDLVVTQVKEKFGGLRFYVSAATDTVHNLIDAAEDKSRTLCEVCGGAGDIGGSSWTQVRCEKHKAKRNAANVKEET